MKKPLSVTHPDIAAQWHPTKNGDLAPIAVVSGSNKRVWWRCPEVREHEWRTEVKQRTRDGTGCPQCSGRLTSRTNSLAARFPDIAAQWHPTRNGDLTPDRIVAGSHKRVVWKCSDVPEHEWEAVIQYRTLRGTGCPQCTLRVASRTNSLTGRFPDIAAQWHPTRNGDLTPDQVLAGSGKRVVWKCSDVPEHEWEATVVNRTGGTGCPQCSGRLTSKTTSLTTRFPNIAAQCHPAKNGDLIPNDVTARSTKRVWWVCPNVPEHEWQARVRNRTAMGQGCPICGLGWTIENIRCFVSSLRDHLSVLTGAELYVLFQQNGLLQTMGRGRAFLKALVTGRFPTAEVDKFIAREPSLVDEFVEEPTLTYRSDLRCRRDRPSSKRR